MGGKYTTQIIRCLDEFTVSFEHLKSWNFQNFKFNFGLECLPKVTTLTTYQISLKSVHVLSFVSCNSTIYTLPKHHDLHLAIGSPNPQSLIKFFKSWCAGW